MEGSPKERSLDSISTNEESLLILASREGQLSLVKQLVEGKCLLNHKGQGGKTALHWACVFGHRDIVEFLVDNGANLEEKDWTGDTPLAMACENSHWDIIRHLVNSGCSVDFKNKDGKSLLILAVKEGHFSLVKQLIERKCNVNKCWKGRAALHCACEYGHADIVKLLVKEGANLEEKDRKGDTPLAMACRYRHWDIVHCLVLLGCSVTTINKNGETLLNLALRGKQIPLAILKLFVERKCDLQAKDKESRNALHWAIYHCHAGAVEFLVHEGADLTDKDRRGRTCLHWASVYGLDGIVEYLIKRGANLEEKDLNGDTPLATACRYSRWDIVRSLVTSGCSVTTINKKGKTLMILAVSGKRIPIDIAKLLVQRKCDLKFKDEEGKNALHWASYCGCADAVEFLVQEGSDLKDIDERGSTCLHLAAFNGHAAVADYLIKRGANLEKEDSHGKTPLAVACENRHWDTVSRLVNSGCSLNLKNMYDESFLGLVIKEGQVSLVKQLIERKCDLDYWNEDWKGRTALHAGHADTVELLEGFFLEKEDCNDDTPLAMACRCRRWEIVRCLVNSGCSVTAINKNGETLLNLAVREKKIPIAVVKLLVQGKCDLHAKDRKGRTALHWACVFGCADVMEFLVQEGSDLKDIAEGGRTCLHLASFNGHAGVVDYLIKRGANLEEEDCYGNTALTMAFKSSHSVLLSAKEDIKERQVSLVKLFVKRKRVLNHEEEKMALHWACQYGHPDIVEILIEKGANLEENISGYTPLAIACRNDHWDVVRCLVDSGCSVKFKDEYSESLLILAIKESQVSLVKHLIERKCDWNYKNEHWKRKTALHYACEYGLADIVDLLVKEGANIEEKDANGGTPLAIACCYSHWGIVRYLVNLGCSVTVINKNGETVMSLVVRGKQVPIAIVKLLVQRKCDFRAKDTKGRNAFHWASYYGHAGVVAFLITQGANWKEKDTEGKTALHLASSNGHVGVVGFLLQEGADLNDIDDRARTCLHLACSNGHDGVADYLVKRGANLGKKDCNGNNSLTMASENSHWDVFHRLLDSGFCDNYENAFSESLLIWFTRKRKILLVKQLIERKCDLNLNHKDSTGRTALHWACEYGHPDIVEILIEKGANLEGKNRDGKTPLAVACENRDWDIVSLLVNSGCCVNFRNEKAESLLGLVIKEKQISIVKQLIERKCDLNYENEDWKGRTALNCACEYGCLDIVKLLVNEGANLEEKDWNGDTPLTMACRYKRWNIVRCLVIWGCSVTEINENGETVLILAVKAKLISIATVKLLVQRKCDLKSKDMKGRTALHWACYYDHADAVKFLVQESADLKDKDWEGRTALHIASFYGCSHLVGYLVGQGTDLKDTKGWTALHLASLRGHAGVVEYLVEQGADLKGKDEFGKTALHLASSRGHAGVVECLVKQGANLEVVDDLLGDTPLMAACRGQLRENVVRCLLDKNICVNTKNKNGQSALHLACGGGRKSLNYPQSIMSELRRRLLSVLNMLVANGCDIDVTDKHGETPFSYFLDLCHLELGSLDIAVARKFASSGALLDTTSVVSKTTVLHLLSFGHTLHEKKVIDALHYLLTKGANPERQDKKGNFPYEHAHGKVRNSLRRALEDRRYSRLSKLGVTNPKRIKVCLIGDGGAGKTTLLKSLSRKMEEHIQLLASEIGVDDPTDPDSRTAGVDVVVAHIDQAGELVFCDFAGQENFHKTHSFFFSQSNTIYVLVVDLTKSDEEMCASSSYWLSFVKCTTGALSGNSKVLLIGSRGDKRDGRAMKRLLKCLSLKFKEYFSFSEEHFVLDCRLCGSDDMSEVRQHLGKLKKECLKKSFKVPIIVEDVQSVLLPKLRQLASLPADSKEVEKIRLIPKSLEDRGTGYSTYSEDLVNFGLSNNQIKPLHGSFYISYSYFSFLIDWNVYRGISKQTLRDLVRFLVDIGEIIEIDGQVIYDPPWLCHNIIGPVMSPDTFPVHMEGVDDGKVSVAQIENVLEDFNKQTRMSTEEALKILCELDICYPVAKEKKLYCIPALIQEKPRAEIWIEKAEMEVYVGRRLQCKLDVDIIIPGTIPFLQTRSALRLDRVPLIWKDGLILQKAVNNAEFVLEGLIELQERARAIDVIVRGPRLSEKECLDLVEEMADMVRTVLDDRSPATDIVELFLSHSELKKLAERPPAYSLPESKNSLTVTAILGRKKYTESLRNLLVVPGDHYVLLPLDVKQGLLATLNDNPRLKLLGKKLGMRLTDVSICGNSADRLLEKWSEKQDAVVSKLVDGLKEMHCKEALKILYSDGRIQPQSKEEPLGNRLSSVDLSKPENQVVEEEHVRALMEEVLVNDDDVVSIAKKLRCWSHTKASQFVFDNKRRPVGEKFFLLVEDWKTEKPQGATIGKLLESLYDAGTTGVAIRILNDCFSLDLIDFWYERLSCHKRF